MAMDFEGICFWLLLEENSTLNAEWNKKFLDRKIPNWLQGKNFRRPILLHDNARLHKSTVVTNFLQEKQINCWFHPPYSPDISPLDFNCFGALKRQLKGIKFDNWTNFEEALVQAVTDLNSRGMMRGVQDLPERWKRVIEAKGDYI